MRPPHCLRLDDPPTIHGRHVSATGIPPIHVHINNQPLATTSRINAPDTPRRGLKRRNSSPSDLGGGDSDSESIALSDILEGLHRKFPKLNFPQYSRIFQARGIFYAESAAHFDREYFLQLGVADGAVGLFLSAVRRAINRQQGAEKRARVSLKENDI